MLTKTNHTGAKRIVSLLLTLAMLATLGTSTLLAQEIAATPSDGPGTAVQPSMGAVTIAPNSWQWYIFRSQVPVNVDADGNDIVTNPEDATINATLRAQSGNLDFEVWSQNDLNNWYNSSDFDPLGRGTENEFIAGDPLFWQGSFETNNNYYLIVMNRGAAAASYTLDISGHVRFPSELSLDSALPALLDDQPVMSTGELALTAEAANEEMSSMTIQGTSPETALRPAAGSVTIAPNSWQWYSFRTQLPVNVDADGNDIVTNPEDATVQAALRTQSGSVSFDVYSRDNLRDLFSDSEFDALGQGTENEFLSGDPLFWQGSFKSNDIYYLVVQNSSAEPAAYTLNITGNMSFPADATLVIE